MTRFLRHLGVNLALGTGAAVALVAGLFALDVARLRTLVMADGDVIAPILLLFGFVITFGSVGMGVAIMALGRKGEGDGGRPQRRPAPMRGDAAVARAHVPARMRR